MKNINGNIRAELARRQITYSDAAEAMGMSFYRFRDRIYGVSEWRVSEIYALVQVLGCAVYDILPEKADFEGVSA